MSTLGRLQAVRPACDCGDAVAYIVVICVPQMMDCCYSLPDTAYLTACEIIYTTNKNSANLLP